MSNEGKLRAEAEAAAAFMFEHAGWSYNPATETPDEGRMRGAHHLAIAEAWAEARGLYVTWQDDWSVGSHRDYYGPDSAYSDGEPESCELAILYDDAGRILASLGCIDGATPEYRRVVEAELAQGVMPHLVILATAETGVGL
jgi:hypothetical protein